MPRTVAESAAGAQAADDCGHLEMMLFLMHLGLLVQPLRVSLVMGVRGGTRRDPTLFADLARDLLEEPSWQVVGVAKADLPMTTVSPAIGCSARTRKEDTLTLDEAVPAASNAQLVVRLVSSPDPMGSA
jgi:uncharacterized protein (DUF849 family)